MPANRVPWCLHSLKHKPGRRETLCFLRKGTADWLLRERRTMSVDGSRSLQSAELCSAPPASGVRSAKAIAAAKWKLSAASLVPTAWFPFPCANAPTTRTVACPAHPRKPTPPAAVSASSPLFLCRTKIPGRQKARSPLNKSSPASSKRRGGRSSSRSELPS
jgi:hypothetical protein